MLDKNGFDLWADNYDEYVNTTDEENKYPFAGYREVLGSIYRTIMKKQGCAVLDLGFGTGTLTSKLYKNGCDVYGQDFSKRMIELAHEKMPEARLYQGDFSEGLAEPLRNQSYDFIVATYALHHLNDEEKVILLRSLFQYLKEGGRILVGDISFETREQLERCKEEAGDEWDEEEIYVVADELREAFPGLEFKQISFCSGIVTLGK